MERSAYAIFSIFHKIQKFQRPCIQTVIECSGIFLENHIDVTRHDTVTMLHGIFPSRILTNFMVKRIVIEYILAFDQRRVTRKFIPFFYIKQHSRVENHGQI